MGEDLAGGDVSCAVAVVAPVSWVRLRVALSWNLLGFYCGSPSRMEDAFSKNALRECVFLIVSSALPLGASGRAWVLVAAGRGSTPRPVAAVALDARYRLEGLERAPTQPEAAVFALSATEGPFYGGQSA